MSIPVQGDNRASSVPKMAKQEAETCDPATWDWVEASDTAQLGQKCAEPGAIARLILLRQLRFYPTVTS